MKYLITGGSGFIGTNLVEELIGKGIDFVNLDIAPPKIQAHMGYWVNLDIMDYARLEKSFSELKPTHVIHLAARTDTTSNHMEDYLVNTTGTENVLAAINATNSVQRVVIASTQFVNQYSGQPKDDFDFAPHTIYGESKIITEKLTRKANLNCCWTIVRPTNIWGPWHPRYPHEFWKIVGSGLYFHPGKEKVVRSYGYVKNVNFQILKICESNFHAVSGKVFYVGDEPMELIDWANGFCLGQTGKNARVLPTQLVRSIALLGDALALIGIKFPLTSSRYKSMTTSNSVSMAGTIQAFGEAPYSLQQGIDETIEWLGEHHPELVRIKQS